MRLWDFALGQCLAIVCGHQSGVMCLDISPDSKAMAAVGLDGQGRQLIAVWDVSGFGKVPGSEKSLEYGCAPPLVLRKATEYNIRCLRFSPYEDDVLWTCGKASS